MKNTLTGRGRRRAGLGLLALLALALVIPACSDNNPTIPNIPRAGVVVTVEPNPVIGVQNVLTGSVSAAYVIVIRELAGLGGQIQFVNSTTFDPETGIQVSSSYFDSAALKVFVGTDRVEPEGEVTVTQTSNYTLPDFRVPADLTVNVQVLDDQGNLITQSILARIVPPEV